MTHEVQPASAMSGKRRPELTANLGPIGGDLTLHVYRVGKRSKKDSPVKGYFSLDAGPGLRLLSGSLREGPDGSRFISPPGLMRQVRGRPCWTCLWRFLDRRLQARVLAEVERLLAEDAETMEPAKAIIP